MKPTDEMQERARSIALVFADWLIVDDVEDAIASALASERARAIEECAQVADAEQALRIERMHSDDPIWGHPLIQGHKSVTAMAIAKAIRALAGKD